MKKSILAVLLACFFVAPCLGQDFDLVKVPDTLFLANGATQCCLIKEMDNGSRYIKAKTITRGDNKVVRLPLEKVARVVFADGLSIDVSKTGFDRSGLLAWPNKRAADKNVVVDNIITLTQPEVRAFYGDELFYGEYRPMRYQSIAGGIRFGIGVASTLFCGVWSASTPSTSIDWGFLLGFNFNSAYAGAIHPEMVCLTAASRGFVYAGLLDMFLANISGRKILANRSTMKVHSRTFAWGEVLLGAGVTAAGSWMVYNQWAAMNRYRGKFFSASSDTAFHDDMVRAFTLSFVGSFVANLGLSAMIKGSSRLANFHPSGLGLVYNF